MEKTLNKITYWGLTIGGAILVLDGVYYVLLGHRLWLGMFFLVAAFVWIWLGGKAKKGL